MENEKHFDLVPNLEGQVNFYIYKNTDFKGWHMHEHQEDHIYIAEGILIVYIIEGDRAITRWLIKGDTFTIPTKVWHGIQAKEIGTKVVYYYDKKFDVSDTQEKPYEYFKR